MSKPQSPCLNCENRQVNCHGNCKQYSQYKYELDCYNINIRQSKKADDDHYEYIQARRNRRK